MDSYPLQLTFFGLADRFFEPFCYGCAGFILSFRVTSSIAAKVLAIASTIGVFLWMDDIWPAIAARSANLGAASGAYGMNQLVDGARLLGEAEFSTGQVAGLWDVFVFSAWDLGSALLFVPLAFVLGLKITDRRWNELPSIFVLREAEDSKNSQNEYSRNEDPWMSNANHQYTETEKLASMYSPLKILLKILHIAGIWLGGGIISTLLRYAGVGGAIPAIIVILPVLYGLNRVWRSEGGKPATLIFFGTIVLIIVVVAIVV